MITPHTPRAVPQLATRAPERLVGVGFRCWIGGLATADERCWSEALATYTAILGPDLAKAVLIDLSQFACAVQANSARTVHVMTPGCRGFCRDECLAISMIAASQHGARSALLASARALVGGDDIGDTLNGAQTLAGGLARVDQILSPSSVCPATCALAMARTRPV